MKRIIGFAAAAAALAVSQPAPAQVTTRAQLIVNFRYSESYTRKYAHNDERISTTENMSFHGTAKRNYVVTLLNGQLTDVHEMSPDEAKKMGAGPAASGSGGLSYDGDNLMTDKVGLVLHAKKNYSATFGNDAVAVSLFATDAGMTLRTAVNSKSISGSCTLTSKNANAAGCGNVPLPGLAPDVNWTSANSGTFAWTNDYQEKPTGGIKMPDAYSNFMLGMVSNALSVKPGAQGNSSYTFNQTWQFEKNNQADGDQVGRKTIDANATLQVHDVKCTLTDAMMQSAFAVMKSYYAGNAPLQNFQTHASGANAMQFSFGEPAVANNFSGFTVTGTATLSNEDFQVKAQLAGTGGKPSGRIQSDIASGCVAGSTSEPALNSAFAEATSSLIENHISGH